MEFKTSRRGLLKAGISQMVLQSLYPNSAMAKKTEAKNHSLPIMQGATSASQTQIVCLIDKHKSFEFLALIPQTGTSILPTRVRQFERKESETAVVHIYFQNLQLNQDYQFVIKNSEQEVVESRFFQTLDVEKNKARMAFASCMHDEKLDTKIWQSLYEQKPDVIFFVGDSVYADSEGPDATPAVLWRRFCQARTRLPYSYWPHLIPIFAIWDDHDFGANDKGMEYPHVEESQTNFQVFFPFDEAYCDVLTSGPGIAQQLSLFQQKFHLMDNRSFRQEKGSTDIAAHWGKDQQQWHLDCLDQGGFHWVISGSQMFPGGSIKESMSGDHKENLIHLKKQWQTKPARLLFVSGDIHFSELTQISTEHLGYPSLEITSSCMHSFMLPGLPWLYSNKNRIVSATGSNFVLVQCQWERERLDLIIQSIDKKQRVNFTHHFHLENS
ncbi:MAG: alkaline phosphatase family protein [Bdellovibrionales bacterium]|nr:alkaline phosphatase family protein [Bdellovibrionales bacterium]